MAIIAKDSGGDFETPPEGLHRAVCVDVVDVGMRDTSWGPKHKVQIRWIIDKKDARGMPFMVVGSYTLSLNEKAALCKMLESWRNKKFTSAEKDGFNLEGLLAVNCQLQIIHSLGDNGKVWANVQTVVPAPAGVEPMGIPRDYVRACNRDNLERPAPSGLGVDEVPF